MLRWTGTILVMISCVGLIGLGIGMLWPDGAGGPVEWIGAADGGAPLSGGTARDVDITRVVLPAIGLDAEVVPAALVQRDGGLTWEVLAFRIGHAEGTAGAGGLGNAILLGHVTSLRSGNVFAELDRADVGDRVQVFGGDQAFDYTVVSKRHVARDDRTVAEPGDARAVSLITCTGVWLPTIWDYTEGLVVRAELSRDQAYDR